MGGLVLVTGGAGFIGSHLVRALLESGHCVRVLDNLSSGRTANLAGILNDFEFREGDVRNERDVDAAMCGVQQVFHEAALVSVPASVKDPGAACDIIVRGTLNVLRAALLAGTQRVIIAGSSAVYGDIAVTPKSEAMAPRTLSPYAAAKSAAEMWCLAFYGSYGLETTALRYFNVYGPRQDPHSPYAAVIPRFVQAFTARQRPVIYGDGEQTRDFVYVDDVVRANLLALKAPRLKGEAVNIGSGRAISLNGLLGEIAGILGTPIEAIYQPARPGDVRESLADLTLARNLFGFQPLASLNDGLSQLIKWWGQVFPESAGPLYARA